MSRALLRPAAAFYSNPDADSLALDSGQQRTRGTDAKQLHRLVRGSLALQWSNASPSSLPLSPFRPFPSLPHLQLLPHLSRTFPFFLSSPHSPVFPPAPTPPPLLVAQFQFDTQQKPQVSGFRSRKMMFALEIGGIGVLSLFLFWSFVCLSIF